MEFKKILDYQKKDAEIIKLERGLNSSENRKIFTQMISVVKDAQNQSTALENQAGEIISSFENLKKSYQENSKSADKIASKDFDELTSDDLDTIEKVAKTIFNNLGILEKKLLAEAELVRSVLQNFDNAKKRYNTAKEKYNKHKELYDEDVKKLKPILDEKNKELKQLEDGIDQNLLAKYKQKRQDRIYPVFVPCVDKTCGGCRMELPSASLSILKKDGILECEHCHRIIYSQD